MIYALAEPSVLPADTTHLCASDWHSASRLSTSAALCAAARPRVPLALLGVAARLSMALLSAAILAAAILIALATTLSTC